MTLLELFLRFSLLFISVVFLYFFSKRNYKAAINPLIIVVGFCTFSLCYLFTKVEIGIGIGFGLFAIFSILRFRAQTFSINAIIFLFAIITLSILDVLFPIEEYGFLLFFQLIIVLFYMLGTIIFVKGITMDRKTCKLVLKCDEFCVLNEKDQKTLIAETLPFETFDFEILSINKTTDEVEILIFY